MSSSWGRPPKNDLWQDLQALAFWVLLIGIGGFILFPNLFGDVYDRLTDAGEYVDTTSGNHNSSNENSYSYNTDEDYSQGIYDNPNSYNTGNYTAANSPLYFGNEIANGYWVLFVAEGDFKQLSITSDAYAFLLRLIEKDVSSNTGSNTLILAANGQIKKFVVTDEIYGIVQNMSAIETRARLS
ncbi:MAG: hypothetical protein GX958_07925 [Desulfitobacterium sp.]|nr:hypothetical protein [Desulfitobacterium sp.]